MYSSRGLFYFDLVGDRAKINCANCNYNFKKSNFYSLTEIVCPRCDQSDKIDEDNMFLDWNEDLDDCR